LGVEFRVQVRIYIAEAADAVVLSRTAIFRGEKRDWQAMVVRDRKLALAELRVGLMNDEEAQIKAGVTPDDRVVARPGNELSPGMRVTVMPFEK
jgi:multidrug efflux pump subunit AcrA (membrane-fusion protein)